MPKAWKFFVEFFDPTNLVSELIIKQPNSFNSLKSKDTFIMI